MVVIRHFTTKGHSWYTVLSNQWKPLLPVTRWTENRTFPNANKGWQHAEVPFHAFL